MVRREPLLRVGTSGYQYTHWRGVFYPERLPQREWLPFFARDFDTVELNVTFYRLPRPETFTGWRARTPAGFLFAVKYSRFGTHMKHLRDPQAHLEPFLDATARLGRKLGPILVQLPPKWKYDGKRLAEFLAAAPRRQRWALEFRHASWLNEECYGILRAHGAALCIHDHIKPHPEVLTAGWTYLRFHGGAQNGNYTGEQLKAAAERVRQWRAAGHDVYAYFNNDWHGYALENARALRVTAEAARPAAARSGSAGGE